MKYSLRSLMIGLTLFCVLLGGRIEYLRRWAVFHAREADFCDLAIRQLPAQSSAGGIRGDSLLRARRYAHQELAREYSAAVYRPWSLIRSPQPPATYDEMLEQMVKRIETVSSGP